MIIHKFKFFEMSGNFLKRLPAIKENGNASNSVLFVEHKFIWIVDMHITLITLIYSLSH